MSDDLRNRVARAIQAVEIPESGWPEDRAGVWLMALDEAVKAADAALAEIGEPSVQVKPLVFDGEESDCFMTCDRGSRSYDLFVVDTLERSCDYVWKATHCESGLREYDLGGGTLEDAKAAAQAHHEARILAAIEPAPSVREAARVLLGAGCDGVPWLTWGIDNHLNGPPSYAVGDAPWPAPDGNEQLADAVRSALTTIAEAED